MKAAVVVFPGSNCDRDALHGLEDAGYTTEAVWHAETSLPAVDLIMIPGGFSYGDHLRSGAIAARSRIMTAVRSAADRGVPVLGVCNGFQILTEAGLLPGALLRNENLHFVCRTVTVRVESTATVFTRGITAGSTLSMPVAHGEGRYHADSETLARLEDSGRVVFRYTPGGNPNGSVNDIAGISHEAGNVVGLMPHPERSVSDLLGSTDGLKVLRAPLEYGIGAAL